MERAEIRALLAENDALRAELAKLDENLIGAIALENKWREELAEACALLREGLEEAATPEESREYESRLFLFLAKHTKEQGDD